MSISEAAAKSASDAAKAALVAADNAIFITGADAQINQAIDLGQNYISATTWGNVSAKDIFMHYHDLGYTVWFPDEPLSHGLVPAQLFGEFWEAFWNNTLFLANTRNPCRMIISWQV